MVRARASLGSRAETRDIPRLSVDISPTTLDPNQIQDEEKKNERIDCDAYSSAVAPYDCLRMILYDSYLKNLDIFS
jgi:hypothetical protein